MREIRNELNKKKSLVYYLRLQPVRITLQNLNVLQKNLLSYEFGFKIFNFPGIPRWVTDKANTRESETFLCISPSFIFK